MADLYYYESGYIDNSYFVYTADAESAQSSTFAITATVGVIKQFAVALTSTTSTNCNGGFLIQGTIDIGFYYDYGYIDPNYFYEEGSNASLTTTAIKIINSSSTMSAAFTQTATASKIINNPSTISAAFTQATTASKIISSSSTMSAAFTQTATISHIHGVDLFAFTNAALTAEAGRIRNNNIQASAAFNVAVQGVRGIYISAQADSAFTANIANLRVRTTEAAANAAFSLTANINVLRDSQAQLNAVSSLNTQTGLIIELTPQATGQGVGSFDVTAQASINVNAIRTTTVNLTAAFTQSATISHIEGVDMLAFTNAALAAQNNRIRDNSISSTSAFSITADATRILYINAQASMSTNAALTAIVNVANKRPRAITTYGSPSFSTTKKFGSHSVYLPKPTSTDAINTNYLSISGSSDFAQWGTIDFWVNYPYEDGRGTVPLLWYGSVSTTIADRWQLEIAGNYSGGGYLRYREPYPNDARINWDNGLLPLNTWNHIHLKRVGNTITAWINGSLANIQSTLDSMSTSYPTTGEFRIGYAGFGGQNSVLIDELLVRTSAINGGTVPTAEWTIGKAADVQMLFHFNNNYVDDMSGTEQAQASLSSSATLSTAVDNRTRSAAASLESNGFIAVINSRIRPDVADLTTSTALTAQASVIKSLDIALTSTTALTAEALDLDIISANLSSEFAVNAQINLTKISSVSLASNASLTISSQLTRNLSASLESSGFVIAVSLRIRPDVADLTTAFSLEASIKKTTGISASLTAESTLTAQALDLDIAQASLSAAFSLSAGIGRINPAQAECIAGAAMTTSATKIIPSWKVDYWGKGLTNNQGKELVLVSDDSYEIGIFKASAGGSSVDSGITIIKRSVANGTIQWRKNYAWTASAVNSSLTYSIQEFQSNLYANIGYYNSTTQNYFNSLLVINPADGSVTTSISLPEFITIQDFIVNSTGIYVSGQQRTQLTQGDIAKIAKYSLAGTLVWNTEIAHGTNNIASGQRLFIRNSQLYWAYTNYYNPSDRREASITKINSSTGAITWTQAFGFAEYQDIYVDTNENIYALGAVDIPINSYARLIKINSQGQKQWAKDLGWQPARITTDADSNIYLATSAGAVISLNASGQQRWAWTWSSRDSIFNPYQEAAFRDIVVNDDYLFILGTASGTSATNPSLLWTVPSLTGGNQVPVASFPYGVFRYQTLSLNVSTPEYALPTTDTPSTQSGTVGGSSFTAIVSNNTETAFNYFYAVNATGSWTSTTSQTAIIGKLVGISTSLTAQASQQAQAQKNANLAVELVSTSNLAVINQRARDLASSLTSSTSLLAQAIKATVTTASLNTAVTATAQVQRLRGINSLIASAASLTALATKQVKAVISTQAIATELTVAAKTGQGLIALDAQASLTVQAKISAGATASLTANTSLTTQVENVRNVEAALASQASLTVQGDYLRRPQANLTATASLSALGVIARLGQAAVTSTTALTANTENSSTIRVQAGLTAQASQQTSAKKFTGIIARLNSEFTRTFVVGSLTRFEANLTCQGFQLTAGRIIHIDPYFQLRIEKETRYLIITEESRLLAIEQETRVNKIQGR